VFEKTINLVENIIRGNNVDSNADAIFNIVSLSSVNKSLNIKFERVNKMILKTYDTEIISDNITKMKLRAPGKYFP
jgi:uncharacterized FAD-dependent dehydrogenase